MNRSRRDFWFYCIVSILALLTIVPRFIVLEERPLHHDEAQHAWYGYDFMLRGHYNHSPILHGPSLIMITGLTYSIFGDSIGVGRGMIAVFSLIAMLAAAALFPKRLRWWIFPLLVTSPYLLYYSRFLRNELIFCALVLLGILGFVRSMQGYVRRREPGVGDSDSSDIQSVLIKRAAWGMLGPAPIIALLAFKENAIFIIATGLAFALVWITKRLLWRRTALILRMPLQEIRRRRGHRRKPAPLPFSWFTPEAIATVAGWLAGCVIGIAYVLFIYGVTTSDGTFSPLKNIQSSIDYWSGQQSEHRISGALHYHLVIMLVYELPILLMLALGLILDAVRKPMRLNLYMLSIGAWLFIWWIWSTIGTLPGVFGSFQNFLHIEADRSLLVVGLWIVPLLVWSILALKEHWVLGSFMGFWAACSLFQYSVAGEKVPWLGVHIVLPIYMALAWVWAPILRRASYGLRTLAAAAMIVATLIAVRNDYYLIGSRAADPAERMVYNHTTIEYDHMCREFVRRWERLEPETPLTDRRAIFVDDLGWPSCWYFRHFTYELPKEAPSDPENADLILGVEASMQSICARADKARWRCTTMSLRDNWMPGWPDGSKRDKWRAWWNYYWYRELWSSKGGFSMTVMEPLYK